MFCPNLAKGDCTCKDYWDQCLRKRTLHIKEKLPVHVFQVCHRQQTNLNIVLSWSSHAFVIQRSLQNQFPNLSFQAWPTCICPISSVVDLPVWSDWPSNSKETMHLAETEVKDKRFVALPFYWTFSAIYQHSLSIFSKDSRLTHECFEHQHSPLAQHTKEQLLPLYVNDSWHIDVWQSWSVSTFWSWFCVWLSSIIWSCCMPYMHSCLLKEQLAPKSISPMFLAPMRNSITKAKTNSWSQPKAVVIWSFPSPKPKLKLGKWRQMNQKDSR